MQPPAQGGDQLSKRQQSRPWGNQAWRRSTASLASGTLVPLRPCARRGMGTKSESEGAAPEPGLPR